MPNLGSGTENILTTVTSQVSEDMNISLLSICILLITMFICMMCIFPCCTSEKRIYIERNEYDDSNI